MLGEPAQRPERHPAHQPVIKRRAPQGADPPDVAWIVRRRPQHGWDAAAVVGRLGWLADDADQSGDSDVVRPDLLLFDPPDHPVEHACALSGTSVSEEFYDSLRRGED